MPTRSGGTLLFLQGLHYTILHLFANILPFYLLLFYYSTSLQSHHLFHHSTIPQLLQSTSLVSTNKPFHHSTTPTLPLYYCAILPYGRKRAGDVGSGESVALSRPLVASFEHCKHLRTPTPTPMMEANISA